MKSLLIIFISILTLGCDRANLHLDEDNGILENLTPRRFMKDGKGGLFNNVKWYSYNMDNHIIFPHMDVFSIKTNGKIYLLQPFGYYHPTDSKLSGFISLRYGEVGEPYNEIVLDASACGSPYSNPEFEACQRDPAKNVFTYLDLKTGTTFKMTDEESLLSTKWDIAFKTTTAKLNAGISGPGNVLGGLLERNIDFFDERGRPKFERISEVLEIDSGLALFQTVDENIAPIYYAPDGHDRVIFEKDWYEADSKNPKSENWWIVRSIEGDSYAKINVTDISQDSENTQITFSFLTQKSGDMKFSEVTQQWTTPQITSQPGIKSFCFDFDEMVEEKCDGKKWDFKLVVFNKLENNTKTSDWRIFTRKEGYGPLKAEELIKIVSEKEK